MGLAKNARFTQKLPVKKLTSQNNLNLQGVKSSQKPNLIESTIPGPNPQIKTQEWNSSNNVS